MSSSTRTSPSGRLPESSFTTGYSVFFSWCPRGSLVICLCLLATGCIEVQDDVFRCKLGEEDSCPEGYLCKRSLLEPAEYRCFQAIDGCIDNDGDWHGQGCEEGDDCNDDAPGITGPCFAGCGPGFRNIAAGTFQMGCDDGDDCWEANAPLDTSPRHAVSLSEYCIQYDEVTAEDYSLCIAAGVCDPFQPESADPWFNLEGESPVLGRSLHPANGITWWEARQYCQKWLGGDLPTEAQWEQAARGVDALKYPWGIDQPDCTYCNFDPSASEAVGCSYAVSTNGPATWEVDEAGAAGWSPHALHDMAGNVREWVRDCYESTYYEQCAAGCTDPVNCASNCDAQCNIRVLRGGSFATSQLEKLRTVHRDSSHPDVRDSTIGFRCVTLIPSTE